MKRKLIFGLILIIIFGCTKEKQATLVCESPASSNEILRSKPIFYPCINPKNPDELIYLQYNSPYVLWEAYIRFNWKTQEKEILYYSQDLNRPRWGVDWIVFNKEGRVYGMEDRLRPGFSVKANAICAPFSNPEVNLMSTSIIYQRADSFNIIGNILEDYVYDTLYEKGMINSWQHDSLAIIANEIRLRIGDPYLDNFRTIITLDSSDIITHDSGAEWINDSILVWANGAGLFRVNIKTKEMIPLLRNNTGMCSSRSYIVSSYSRKADKLLLWRKDIRWTDTLNNQFTHQFVDLKITIIMMNSDGTGEEVIDIPD